VTRRSLVVAIAIALAACGGDDHADDRRRAPTTMPPIPTPTAAVDGTWDATDRDRRRCRTTSDRRHRRVRPSVRAERYDCAATIDERGPEVVYRLDLAAPTDRDARGRPPRRPASTSIVHVLRAAATAAHRDRLPHPRRRARSSSTSPPAAGGSRSTPTAGGAAPAAGAYTLTARPRRARPPASPTRSQSATAARPAWPWSPGSASIAGRRALVQRRRCRGWSPYHHPGTTAVRRGQRCRALVPQGYIDGSTAQATCGVRRGKRLCTDAEWLRACQFTDARTYPYGPARRPGLCNDARARHPAIELFPDAPNPFALIQHPCINQLPDSLAPTGAHPECITPEGIFDLMGNLHEWTADPAGTFRGGFYVDTTVNGPGCLYRTTAHDRSHWDYSTGFRCCADR
jgi:hypothetical protein